MKEAGRRRGLICTRLRRMAAATRAYSLVLADDLWLSDRSSSWASLLSSFSRTLEAGMPVHSSMTRGEIVLGHLGAQGGLRDSRWRPAPSFISWALAIGQLLIVDGLSWLHAPRSSSLRRKRGLAAAISSYSSAALLFSAAAGAGLVEQVDGLVRQKTVGNIPLATACTARRISSSGICTPWKVLVIALDAHEHRHRIVHRWAPPPSPAGTGAPERRPFQYACGIR